ncbi:MAG: alanine racemase [Gammaproteobacteria bacterium]
MKGIAQARIDLQAVRHNFARVRTLAPDSKVLAVLKANAYGHGAVRVARALVAADGFAVARLEEALALRAAGIEHRIVLLGGVFDDASLAVAANARVEPVVHDIQQLKMLERASLARPARVWLKLDTGMRRLGFEPDAAPSVFERLAASDAVADVAALMTHLACADDTASEMTVEQCKRFEAAARDLRVERSLANSAGIIAWKYTHAHWVRPGIMLYGASPILGRTAAQDGLRPAMTLATQLIAVRRARKGERVGYGATHECRRDTVIGTAAIGYGDGYPRHAPDGAPVLVNGRRAALAGRVSMDMVGIDLGPDGTARVGDPVTLWGEGLPIEEIASAAGTIAYELTCAVTARVQVTVADDAANDERSASVGSARVG